METYPVVMLYRLGNEGVDEQGELLPCWRHTDWGFYGRFQGLDIRFVIAHAGFLVGGMKKVERVLALLKVLGSVGS